MDLFDDLPEPTNDPGPVKPKALEESLEQNGDRGEKRKRDQGSSEETQVEEQNQETKKQIL